MTIDDAASTIRCALAPGCTQICNEKYRGDCTDEEVVKAMEMAVDALYKSDKYRWHNLRKDKNDLPVDHKTIIFRLDLDLLDPNKLFRETEYCMGCMVIGYGELIFEEQGPQKVSKLGRYPEKYVLGWRYFDPFEEE